MLSPDHYPYVPRPERQPLNGEMGAISASVSTIAIFLISSPVFIVETASPYFALAKIC